MTEKLEGYFERFRALRSAGPYTYDWAHHHDGGGHGFHLAVGSMIHGDEVGSLPGVLRVMEGLENGDITYRGKVTFFIGNPEAGRAGRRFLEADLNRVFHAEAGEEHEGRRARQIMPILDDCQLFVDLHQTILATRQRFYIFPWSEVGWRWSRALAAAGVWVTRHPGQAFSSGTCCADEYVRLRGLPGITIELGERGFRAEAEDTAELAIRRALHLIDAIAAGETTLVEAAEAQPELDFVHTVHREAFATPGLCLRPGLLNFEPVEEGELLSAPGTPELRAPLSGQVLFPKFPPREDGEAVAPWPREIYRIVQALPEHPTGLFPPR